MNELTVKATEIAGHEFNMRSPTQVAKGKNHIFLYFIILFIIFFYFFFI